MEAMLDNAFSPYLSAEGLWRASCSWASQGCEEQGEWLHDMAVTLLDITELPTSGIEPYAHPPHVRWEA